MAPDRFYEQLPEELELPDNVPEQMLNQDPTNPGSVKGGLRNYLAMILALDEMVGRLLDYLERTGKAENTIVVFTSDHGTQGGVHDIPFWTKKRPYRESLEVPCIMSGPSLPADGQTCDTLTAPSISFPRSAASATSQFRAQWRAWTPPAPGEAYPPPLQEMPSSA